MIGWNRFILIWDANNTVTKAAKRRLLVSNVTTVDGYIAGPKGELEWFVKDGFLTNTEYGQCARELNSSVDAILLGRRTYEEFVSYWPDATDNDPVITEKMNTLPKIVFSNTLDKVGWGKWGNARLVKGDPAEEVRRLKQEEGRDLVIYGSGTLVSYLTSKNLIDEFQLTVQPVILGAGKHQFEDIGEWKNLRLVKTRLLKEGAIILYYQPLV